MTDRKMVSLFISCFLCLLLFKMIVCNKQELALVDQELALNDSAITSTNEVIEVAIISEFDELIKEHASKYGFDWLLISAQIFTESSFNPEVTSSVGAKGLMQIMPSTAKWLGTNPDLLHKPKVNIELGCYYNFRIYASITNDMLEQERLTLMLASYNSGPNRVNRLRQKYSTWEELEPHLPRETRT